jgi:enediyne biosynthesis protein E4
MRTRLIAALILIVIHCCAPIMSRAQPAARPVQTPAIFKDIAAEVGLTFQHFNGMTGKLFLPEVMGSGAALFDFDNDGDLDVFIVQGNVLDPGTKPGETLIPWRGAKPPTARLFRNDLAVGKDGSRALKFTDVTEASGIVANGYGMGVTVGDINNDGYQDLYLTNLGHNQMYLNQGNGTFVEVAKKTGTDDERWSTSAAFFDYDRDGWLDLMVLNYADFSVANSPTCYAATTARDYCTPKAFRAPGNRLLHNKGNGTFEDVTTAAGVDKEFGHGLGVVTADLNGDGWMDTYVANDGDPNQLWINQKNGTFKNEALLAGAAVNRDGKAEAGMGVDAGDVDANGTEDIFITHLMDETNTLFMNLGKGLFEDRTRELGIGMPGRRFTGFGTLLFDYDNDGWLDILIANGAVQFLPELMRKGDPYPLGQPNQLFQNNGLGTFVEVSSQAGETLQLPEVSRGAAFGDIDNDGDIDVLITNNSGPVRLVLNQIGNRNHWLGLRLIGKSVQRDMLGARVEVVISKDRTLWRRARTDGSYLSANDPRVIAGLGNATRIEALRVHWPDGTVDEWANPAIDRYLTLREGANQLKK